MTRVYIEPLGDDVVALVTAYDDVMLIPDMFECDICEAEWPITERWHALSRRPSTGEPTEVMWGCGECGPTLGTKHGEECDHE